MFSSSLSRPVSHLDITLRIRAEGVLRPFMYLIESEGRPSLRTKNVRTVFYFFFLLLLHLFLLFLLSSFTSPVPGLSRA